MSVVRGLFERAGLYVKKYDKLPYGIDWMRDCARICGRGWSPRLVFDVGANRGQTTLALKKHQRQQLRLLHVRLHRHQEHQRLQ